MPRAFIVYSSIDHVPYIEKVLNVVNLVLKSLNIEPIYLSNKIRGGQLYPIRLQELITQSDMGIVILDGLRPNITFEYGLLSMGNIDIIPLKKIDAKVSIKSFFYNHAINDMDSSLAFGKWHFKSAAFRELKDPFLNINEHLSDCQGRHIIVYDKIDNTEDPKSLGRLLRNEIEQIIPQLRSRDGPGFKRLRDLCRGIDLDLLDESIRLLSLFSFLGWREQFKGDNTFQSLRENFLNLFKNKKANIHNINNIFERLLAIDIPILRNYGRYLTVDSDRLISESFDYYSKNDFEFNKVFLSIMNSNVDELKIRFFERLGAMGTQQARDLAYNVISDSDLFQDISVLENSEMAHLFSIIASLSPKIALEKLNNWISPLSPVNIEDNFPFQSTLIAPGNPQDEILWFLSRAAKIDSYFLQAMDILLKFCLPIILYNNQIINGIHPEVNKLALDRFLEQCHSLLGNVKVRTRWNFIKNIDWEEDWSEKYKNATKDLKYRAIVTFLERSWSVTGPVINGAIRVNHYSLSDGKKYEELEICREEAYKILMRWLDQGDVYTEIDDTLFEYFYRNLSEWLKYIPLDDIKSLFEKKFEVFPKKKLAFLRYIDLLRVFKNEVWQGKYSEEHLSEIFQFQDEIEEKLPTSDLFRRKMDLWIHDSYLITKFPDLLEREEYLNTLQIELVKIYFDLEDKERDEITKILLTENFNKSYEFSRNLFSLSKDEQIKNKIEICTKIIEDNKIETISDFYLGLWNHFFNSNREEWKKLLNYYWSHPVVQHYLYKILWLTGEIYDEFRWNKFINLFNERHAEPVSMIDIILYKKLPLSISVDEKRVNLINSIKFFGEMIKNNAQISRDVYFTYIWRLESLLKENEDIFNKDIAKSFLKNFYPLSNNIISQLTNTDILIKFGRLAEEEFKKWLEAGFRVSHHVERGKTFLSKCAEFFREQLYEIVEQIFIISISRDQISEDYYTVMTFKDFGDPKILLEFSDQQIDHLYNLNPSMLGLILGRLIRNSRIEDDFPKVLRKLIIQHHEDESFKNNIFQAFSTGIRVFGGNDYDQQFSGDYTRITKWRESAKNNIFKEWLKELHQRIDTLRDQNRDFWKEMEVK